MKNWLDKFEGDEVLDGNNPSGIVPIAQDGWLSKFPPVYKSRQEADAALNPTGYTQTKGVTYTEPTDETRYQEHLIGKKATDQTAQKRNIHTNQPVISPYEAYAKQKREEQNVSEIAEILKANQEYAKAHSDIYIDPQTGKQVIQNIGIQPTVSPIDAAVLGVGALASGGVGLFGNMAEVFNPLPISFKGMGNKLKNIPGITADAPELGFHALNSNHWALNPKALQIDDKTLGLLYAQAALNRALPVLKHTPLVNPLKKIAEKNMRLTSSGVRHSVDVDVPFINKRRREAFDDEMVGYNGTINEQQDRDLINLYLYGDETGFEKIGDDVLTMDFGKRYDKLYPNTKSYYMNSAIPHNKPVDIQYTSFMSDNESKIKGWASYPEGSSSLRLSAKDTYENPIRPQDDIGGHALEARRVAGQDNPILISQDLWKFNPKDYSSRWASLSHNAGYYDESIQQVVIPGTPDYSRLLAEKQAGILDKLGKPFKLVQNNPIKLQKGGIVKDNNGYWNPDNWGKPVEIDSNHITMKGVNQPLIGISKETGERKLMLPEKVYNFTGTKHVVEIPLENNWLSKYE